MMNALLPLGLLVLAVLGRGSKAKACAPATPATPAKPARPRPPSSTPATPATPVWKPPTDQVEVDAAVEQAVRDLTKPPNVTLAPPKEGSPIRTVAARTLLEFLIRTGRFGSSTDKPDEIKAAQRDLGVPADGMVGPSTRAAALRAGVALPPRPVAKKRR